MNLESVIQIYGGGLGSGCQGQNCGRPTELYHGTRIENKDSIAKNGLRGNKNVPAYASVKKSEAHYYAIESTLANHPELMDEANDQKLKDTKIAVVVVKGDRMEFDPLGGTYGTRPGKVGGKNILRIEEHRIGDVATVGRYKGYPTFKFKEQE